MRVLLQATSAESTLVTPSDIARSDIERILTGIDAGVTAAAIIILVAAAARASVTRRGLLTAAPPRPNRFTEETVLIAVGVYFLAAAILSAIVPGLAAEPWSVLLVDNGARLAGAAVCIWAAERRFEGGVRTWLLKYGVTLGLVVRTVITSGAIVLGVCPLVRDATAWLIAYLAPAFIPQPHPTIERLEAAADPAVTAALWLAAAVLAPVAEELFFRGILQTVLAGLLRNRWAAIGWTALAFGLVHLNQPQAVPALFVMGVFLGFAYERTGALWAPVVIHVAFNLRTLIWYGLAA